MKPASKPSGVGIPVNQSLFDIPGISRVISLGDGVFDIHTATGHIIRATPKQGLFDTIEEVQ